MSLAPDTFHEFEMAPGLFEDDGELSIQFHNPNNTALIFTLDDGMEVLYREGGFGLNFVRGLGISCAGWRCWRRWGWRRRAFCRFRWRHFVAWPS